MTILTLLVTWLKLYWLDVAIVVLFLGFLAYLLKKGKVDLVKRIVYYLVVRAEQQLGSKTGPLKYAMVIAAVYDKLPVLLRLVFTKAEIDKFIDGAVQDLKKLLEAGDVNLLTYSEELGQELYLVDGLDHNEP